MPRKGLTLLIAAGLILSARPGWSETTGAAASTTSEVPAAASAAAPTASTAAPAAVSATAAVTGVTATAYPSTASAPAAATATAQSTAAPAAATANAAPAPAAEPAASAAPAPAAEPAAPTPTPASGIQVPVHGMNMANVEHVFGTPLEKQEAVGKPPITRWVYADYVVYFEYNIVLHTVMKAAPFQSPGAG